ncbi:MAG TPA: TetR/AcrR family transcriptional regulator [Solirubrobacteraceae bacterium]|nr:TetR/AcrR family transcriptional regulator [Solirubrobacteraceae bacterium]
MPYRPTERTEAKRAATRERIVAAAQALIARGGYRAASVAAVAARAGVATGSVYRHFPSKASLFAEVFRRASQREVDAVAAAAAAASGPAPARVAIAVETFARRALRGRRLAWALLAEPVNPAVEAERLVFRRAYAETFAAVVRAGVAARELPPQDPELTARALVGAIGEVLVGVGGTASPTASHLDEEALVAGLVRFCIRSITEEPSYVHAHAA